MAKGFGLIKGLGVTMKEVIHTMFPKRGALTLLPSPTTDRDIATDDQRSNLRSTETQTPLPL